MLKWKDIKNYINFTEDTKILVFDDECNYINVTTEIMRGWNKTPYDNYYLLNIHLHSNIITLINR